ncbi:MAG: Uma2 family endonuclease [Pseudanabaena sp. ELA645]|jgi:Uma2 family endonuclease
MTTLPIRTTQKIIYPDSDGKPMADNTIQFRWIVLIKENLELIFADTADVFVAGDLFWYPVEGHPEICVAPDVMVAFGLAKGDRGSYQQWRENNIAPQVVFEILSPGNRLKEMTKKLQFYDRYGVEEYYIYDPETNELNSLYKHENRLNVIEDTHNWVSPRLQIRFAIEEGDLKIYRPDGQKFLTTLELNQYAEQEHQRAEQESQRAKQEYDRAERLLAQLMAMGIQPL